MTRLAISVEGYTEEEFVKKVIYPHLWKRGILITPISMGGNISVERIIPELRQLYWDRKYDCISTLYDFYGFSKKPCNQIEGLEKYIEDVLQEKVGPKKWREGKFIPYIQLYEFETLLFSDIERFSLFSECKTKDIHSLNKIVQQFNTPEDINNSWNTCPSRRLQKQFIWFDKKVHGPLVAEKIGLQTIREKCPRFDSWIRRLEQLANK